MTERYCSILASSRAVTLFPVKLNVKKNIFIHPEENLLPYLELHCFLESNENFQFTGQNFYRFVIYSSVWLLIT